MFPNEVILKPSIHTSKFENLRFEEFENIKTGSKLYQYHVFAEKTDASHEVSIGSITTTSEQTLSRWEIKIVQCQGQEADAVILSTVQKPTKFLTKCRLNVALSRVRKKLYVLIDTHKLRDACDNHSWETALFARALLSDYE